MADKIPLQALTSGGNVTALSQFNTGDTVPVIHGGTGKVSIGINKILYASAANVYSETDITDTTRTLLSKSSIADICSYLGLVVGTNTGQIVTTSAANTLPVLDARNLKNTLPAGVICFWSGSISTIPANFVLCDGNNGTPDLRDKFIVGAGNNYNVAASGGSDSHTHTVTVQNTTLSISQMPSHTHSVGYGSLTPKGVDSGGFPNEPLNPLNYDVTNAYNTATSSQGGDQPHNHGATVTTSSNLPPYYALAFIMSKLI